MRDLLRRFFSGNTAANVPHAIAGCQDCRMTECGREKFSACEYRLAREATLKAQAAEEAKTEAKTEA
jgi:hypothetical protein